MSIDGYDAFTEATKDLAEDPTDELAVNGVVTIKVSFDQVLAASSELSSLFYLNFEIKVLDDDSKDEDEAASQEEKEQMDKMISWILSVLYRDEN